MGIMIYPASLATRFTFGKHKGKTVGQVIDLEDGYIDWCDDNVSDFDLTQEAWDYHSNASTGGVDYGDSDYSKDDSDPWMDDWNEQSRYDN